MLLPLLAVVGGLVLLAASADRFVFGAAGLARGLGVSPVLIGLTVVAFGTSAPEIIVSLLASLQGAPGLAVGNAIGSNIANLGLVLGLAALIAPIIAGHGLVRRELPLLLLATLGVLLLLLDGRLARAEGVIMLAGLIAVVVWMIRAARHPGTPPESDPGLAPPPPAATPGGLPTALGWLAGGLVVLLASSQALVWGAVEIATALGAGELLIGLTLVAIGTSLPELATTVASALRRETGMALGNVVGSNLFNLLAVLAVPALIAPLAVEPAVLTRDYPVMLALTVAVLLAARFGSGRITRWHGALLLLAFSGYLVTLAITAPAWI
ncbi:MULTISPECIES: calcium/sodium antiporter [unclassified Thioalkalivibrio]|uniref:calcium/sodium antiporter n=1 Tax=unclassified Thioalkalivibrio TaxID=2621013 RepID=UPI00036B9AD8|nr:MULTISPECIES: calcium/sodium antiporter [unclassified Thioalkalivibrio]PYG03134.1 cation:H+ antiporter [Thioalkalivibrio sp. ALE21]